MRAFLSLGSNLGDRRVLLKEAVASLGGGVVAVSCVYETEPMGGPGGQDAFLNIVVELDTELTPRQLLGVCHRLESAAHRVRTERWGPRTLDVDILWVESGPVNEPDLQIPHPRMHARRFVMVPLLDLAPELVPEGWQEHAEGHVMQVEPL